MCLQALQRTSSGLTVSLCNDHCNCINKGNTMYSVCYSHVSTSVNQPNPIAAALYQ